MANERTARARWRSRSLPSGLRSLARDTCPVTSTPNRSRSLALPLAASRRALVGAGYLPGISTKSRTPLRPAPPTPPRGRPPPPPRPSPPPLPPLGGGARKTPRPAALLTLRGLSGVWVRVYFNQFAFFVKLYIFVHLGISPIVIPRASCKGARSLPVRASSKLRAQTNQNQIHCRASSPNSPRAWGAAGAVPRSFVA